jgi:enoyl-CoA hydratase/carnithine racemase
MPETILVTREDGVVTVELNRPERRNAANRQMWLELRQTFYDVAHNRSDRVLVLTGAGGYFCSGTDIADPKGITGEPEDPHLVRMQFAGEVMLALHDVPQPTIAKVRGMAAGAGMSLALNCDLVVAGSDARFSEMFTKRGLSIDGGSSWLLPRLVGMQRAKEIVFFAEVLSAQQALELGLVNRVLPDEELDTFVLDWASRLAKGPPLALGMSKRLLHEGANSGLAEALASEARCQTVNFSTEDTKEAMQAFSEKRDPIFKGR